MLAVSRTKIRLNPDYKKVIPRFFNTGNERSGILINKVVLMNEEDAQRLLTHILNEFASRYRNIQSIFQKHFSLIKYLLPDDVQQSLSEEKKLLIGSYFTMEYSIEAAALFNPSVIEDPDQEGVMPGQKKVIISFRATGESHISSVVFKKGIFNENGMISFEPSGKFLAEGYVTELENDNRAGLTDILSKMALPEDILSGILNQLHNQLPYKDIEVILKNALQKIESSGEKNKLCYDILHRLNTCYELQFPPESDLSERVIFPVTLTEKNGIEDARFVKFADDDGSFTYIGTCTAYDGTFILPQLIITTDFRLFKISRLYGKAAINKNLALFPKKINGRYAMISRIDGINNYIMFSDNLYMWEEAVLLQQPKYPWEYVQVGNAGSPVETEKGWLLITHGVGPMRKYCLGASLFDLNDPTIELGRLKEPLLVPEEDERDGYVPNVVYSCGSIIHGDKLFIPYAVSDHASTFATIPLQELLDEIMGSKE